MPFTHYKQPDQMDCGPTYWSIAIAFNFEMFL